MGRLIFMYDSIVLNPPANAEAVAGYVAGMWPDFNGMVAKYPRALHVSISPFASVDARILDVEKGDATPDQAAPWLQRQLARGEPLPGIYCSVSIGQDVINRVRAAGITDDKWVLWTAHYTFQPHICGPGTCAFPGFVGPAKATQYTDHANGLNLDESECDDTFFQHAPAPGPWRPDYSKFYIGPFPYTRANGQVLGLNERQTLEQHYGAIEHPDRYKDWLAELSHRLVFLRKRVWFEAHKNMLPGSPASFGVDTPVADWSSHRGYRWKELLRATDPASFNRLFPNDPHGAPLPK